MKPATRAQAIDALHHQIPVCTKCRPDTARGIEVWALRGRRPDVFLAAAFFVVFFFGLVHVGVLAARGPGLLDGLVQGGHQVDDLPRLRLRLLKLRRFAVLPLAFDDFTLRNAAIDWELHVGAGVTSSPCRKMAGVGRSGSGRRRTRL
ncbi:DUF6233 domain-containing protein [Streptomyces violaceus]|uniref:DUF6233 domain-containing protein n=1 Tax=Streptomyces violaceus TaxID=1936 RepID=A0ABY9UNY9_STRVL|nr:DUF6233 domain-containing protein [Streptomyces janthinus]WND23490.1 DUF6233 domain-containing protein [Streptomyces janthinus]